MYESCISFNFKTFYTFKNIPLSSFEQQRNEFEYINAYDWLSVQFENPVLKQHIVH